MRRGRRRTRRNCERIVNAPAPTVSIASTVSDEALLSPAAASKRRPNFAPQPPEISHRRRTLASPCLRPATATATIVIILADPRALLALFDAHHHRRRLRRALPLSPPLLSLNHQQPTLMIKSRIMSVASWVTIIMMMRMQLKMKMHSLSCRCTAPSLRPPRPPFFRGMAMTTRRWRRGGAARHVHLSALKKMGRRAAMSHARTQRSTRHATAAVSSAVLRRPLTASSLNLAVAAAALPQWAPAPTV